MILELILSIPVFIIVWFVIFRVVIVLENRRLLKNLPKKLEKQNKKFYDEIKNELLAVGISKEKKKKKEVIESESD